MTETKKAPMNQADAMAWALDRIECSKCDKVVGKPDLSSPPCDDCDDSPERPCHSIPDDGIVKCHKGHESHIALWNCPVCTDQHIADKSMLISAAKAVIDNWESGDLAAAVRSLSIIVAQAEGER